MNPAQIIHCELCELPGGNVVWEDPDCHVVLVDGAEGNAFPGFCRVVWRQHVQEMGDLLPRQRDHIMKIVFLTEMAVRRLMRPDKINLASLGNMTPHLHWHVIRAGRMTVISQRRSGPHRAASSRSDSGRKGMQCTQQ